MDAANRRDSLKQIEELTDEICQGLTVSREVDRGAQSSKNIRSETILVYERGQLIGFALCPMASLKAKTRPLYAKFAAAKNGSKASRAGAYNFEESNFEEPYLGERNFEALIASLDQHGQKIGASQILGAVSTARRSCYKRMLSLGFTPNAYGIAMIKPDLSAYNVDGIYVLDDWR